MEQEKQISYYDNKMKITSLYGSKSKTTYDKFPYKKELLTCKSFMGKDNKNLLIDKMQDKKIKFFQTKNNFNSKLPIAIQEINSSSVKSQDVKLKNLNIYPEKKNNYLPYLYRKLQSKQIFNKMNNSLMKAKIKLNSTFNFGQKDDIIKKNSSINLPINHLVNRFFNSGNNPILRRISSNNKKKSAKKLNSKNHSAIINILDLNIKSGEKIKKSNSIILLDSKNYKKIYEKFLMNKNIFNKLNEKVLLNLKNSFNYNVKSFNISYKNNNVIKEQKNKTNSQTIERKDEMNQKDDESEDIFYKNQKNFYKARKDIIEEPELENEIE